MFDDEVEHFVAEYLAVIPFIRKVDHVIRRYIAPAYKGGARIPCFTRSVKYPVGTELGTVVIDPVF